MLASSGYISQINEDLCIGCSDCNSYCPFGALEVVHGVNHVIYEKCMGCGVCVSKCEHRALSLVRDDAKGIPLEICVLVDEAALAGQKRRYIGPPLTTIAQPRFRYQLECTQNVQLWFDKWAGLARNRGCPDRLHYLVFPIEETNQYIGINP